MAEAHPQRTCAVMVHHNYLCEIDEIYVENRREIEAYSATARVARRTEVTRIPAVVHVIYNTEDQNISEEQIVSQIDALNRDYRLRNDDRENIPDPFAGLAADTLIEFGLAVRDPVGRNTSGITRTATSLTHFPYDPNDYYATQNLDNLIKRSEFGKTAWPSDDYLNMWVCEIQGGLLGYAQFPGGPNWSDGVVINHTGFGTTGTANPPFNLGRTGVHEIAHWLDLLHIWGDDKDGCFGSDNVSDTPNQAGPNNKAPTFPRISCDNGPHGDAFMNYMDYVDDAAMYMFTQGQLARMDAALAGPRASLSQSQGLTPPETTRFVSTDSGGKALPEALAALAREQGKGMKVFDGVDWVTPT